MWLWRIRKLRNSILWFFLGNVASILQWKLVEILKLKSGFESEVRSTFWSLVMILMLMFHQDFDAEVWLSLSSSVVVVVYPLRGQIPWLAFLNHFPPRSSSFLSKDFSFKTDKNCPHHLSLVKSYDPLIRSVPGWIAKLERNFDVGLAGLDKFGNRILNFLLPWGSRYIWWKYIKI